MMKFKSHSGLILGVSVSSRKVEAVLVSNSSSGPMVIRTFSRKRSSIDHSAPSSFPGTEPEIGSDISFDMGSSNDLDGLFLASEFGVPEPEKDDFMPQMQETAGPNLVAMPCDLELQDIIFECADAGYENVRVAFALSTEHLGTAVVKAKASADPKGDEKKNKKNSAKASKKESLLEQLKSTHSSKIVDHKTTFVPLAGGKKNDPSHMAVFALASEPVSPSIKAIRDRKRPFPTIAHIDTEPTLMLGLVRAALLSRSTVPDPEATEPAAYKAEETTVLVRVGAEDTLVLFLSGDKLLHFESIRSITAFDPAETICSRILLMHDEFGVGDADNMLLFSDVSEKNMLDTLSQFFPQTNITLLRDYLPEFQEERKSPLEKEGLLATAVTLRLTRDELYESVFPQVDFLDQKLKSRGFQLPFSWPVAAMIVLLFGSTLFFVHRYFSQNHELEMTRFELSNFSAEGISLDADVLTAKIDSMRYRSEGFVTSLDLLDSLLMGSDRWSRALERTSVNTENISGLWIERWEENAENVLSMTGTATDRDQIVAFASKSGANIESIEFSSIRSVPVYSFKMTMPMKNALPEAASYLKDRASEIQSTLVADPDSLQSIALDGSNT